MYYFIVETMKDKIIVKSDKKHEIIKLYDKYINSYDYLSLSKIYYKKYIERFEESKEK